MYRAFSTVVPIAFASVLLTSACASAGSPSSAQSSSPVTTVDMEMPDGGAIRLEATSAPTVTLSASSEQVWAVLPAVYAALEIPVEINDPAARVYGTRRFTRNRLDGKRVTHFIRCGSQGAGSGALPVTSYRVRLSVLSSVEPGTASGTALVATRVQGSATSVDGTSSATVGCSSTGALEQRIHRLLAEHLAG